MPDYTFDLTPAELADASSFVDSTLAGSATWQSVSYSPDGRGGSTRNHVDTTIEVWARNPSQSLSNLMRAPGEITTEWQFICSLTHNIQPKDVIVYGGAITEVIGITQKGTDSFCQLLLCKRVSS